MNTWMAVGLLTTLFGVAVVASAGDGEDGQFWAGVGAVILALGVLLVFVLAVMIALS